MVASVVIASGIRSPMVAARIESLAHGPHGVARVDGKVHFVRGVVPGDEVELVVEEDHGAYAYARVTRLLASGQARRAAPCPYLPRCGGCPWQHVEYATQAAAKEATLRELLLRIGRVAADVLRPLLRATGEYGYRRRLSLRVEDGEVGLLAAASHDVVPIERCLLAQDRLEGAIPLAREWVGALETRIKRVELVATGEDDRVALVAQAEGDLAAADATTSEALLRRRPRVAGLVLRGRGFRRLFGDDSVRVPLVDGDEMRLRAGDFSQVSDHGNLALIREVLALADPGPKDRIADLFAGAGNLSLPLARRAMRVSLVERSASSVEAARENARRLGLDNLDLVAGAADGVLRGWVRRGDGFDVVVLDPPRSGAAECMRPLRALAPERIVYVSCNPATLARDLKTLAAAYRVEVVQPIDLFPQTYHVEAVALLRRAP